MCKNREKSIQCLICDHAERQPSHQGKLLGRIFRGRPPLALDEALRVLGAALAAGSAAPPVLLCFAAARSLYGSPREAVAQEKVPRCHYVHVIHFNFFDAKGAMHQGLSYFT